MSDCATRLFGRAAHQLRREHHCPCATAVWAGRLTTPLWGPCGQLACANWTVALQAIRGGAGFVRGGAGFVIGWGGRSSFFLTLHRRLHARGRVQLKDPQTKRQQHVGYFASEEDAARAYDCAAMQAHGPGAKRNFPGEAIGEPPVSKGQEQIVGAE
jgi:hypothetical protein